MTRPPVAEESTGRQDAEQADSLTARTVRRWFQVANTARRQQMLHEVLSGEDLRELIRQQTGSGAYAVLWAALVASQRTVEPGQRRHLLFSQLGDEDLVAHFRQMPPGQRSWMLDVLSGQEPPSFTARADEYQPGEIPPDARIPSTAVMMASQQPFNFTRFARDLTVEVIVRPDGVTRVIELARVPHCNEYLAPETIPDPDPEQTVGLVGWRVSRVEHLPGNPAYPALPVARVEVTRELRDLPQE